MENLILRLTKILFAAAFFSSATISVRGTPVQIIKGPILEAEGATTNQNDLANTTKAPSPLNCNPVEYALDDIMFLKTGNIFLKSENVTVQLTNYRKEGDKVLVCQRISLNCTKKFVYESDEYQILPNGSAEVHHVIISPGEYEIKGKKLLKCAPDFLDYSTTDDNYTSPLYNTEKSIVIGQIGNAISVVALMIHLIIFCSVPALRNLPGYNLASLSVAFMLGYSFVLIGQIPEVLDLFCVISAILQQVFFLAAFFSMNVLAFDVWRTLKLATEKLAVGSQNTRKRQFIWYSMYSWGSPLVITSISVIVDNCDDVPDSIKPNYGRDDTCWLNNDIAKTIFFIAPAFTLFIINGIFFIRSSWMISSNTMKCTNDQTKQTVQLNYIMYLRLALLMGLTWLLGVIALISKNDVLWFIFDLFNSLQGLFIFLLFTCTRKVLKHLKGKTIFKRNFPEKQMTISSSYNNFSTKTITDPESKS